MKRLGLILIMVGLIGTAVTGNVYANQHDRNISSSRDNIGNQMIQQTAPRPIVGHPAPPFSLKGLDGKTYALSGKREKPLILNFWASWCGPCQAEAPYLRELYLKYKDKIDLYAINATADDKLESAKEFVKKYQLPFPIPLDEKGEVSSAYRLYGYPTTFFIDKSGIIRKVLIGVAEPKDFDRYVKELIGSSS